MCSLVFNGLLVLELSLICVETLFLSKITDVITKNCWRQEVIDIILNVKMFFVVIVLYYSRANFYLSAGKRNFRKRAKFHSPHLQNKESKHVKFKLLLQNCFMWKIVLFSLRIEGFWIQSLLFCQSREFIYHNLKSVRNPFFRLFSNKYKTFAYIMQVL